MPPEVVAAAQQHLAYAESVGQRRMAALHGGRRDDLVVAPNLWAGFGLVRGGAGTALVGSHDEVADRIAEYHELGFDHVILSGQPHLEEAYWFGEGVIPRLRQAGLLADAALRRRPGRPPRAPRPRPMLRPPSASSRRPARAERPRAESPRGSPMTTLAPAAPRLDVRPLTGTIGAEIRGVDLREPLDDATVAEIRGLWVRHKVVFFRDQHLEPVAPGGLRPAVRGPDPGPPRRARPAARPPRGAGARQRAGPPRGRLRPDAGAHAARPAGTPT